MQRVLIILILLFLVGCTSQITGRATQIDEIYQNTLVGSKVGQVAPDFTINTIEGEQITLQDLKKERKPVIVYFYATWCPQCHFDVQYLGEALTDFKDEVELLAVTIDPKEQQQSLETFRDRYNFGFTYARGNPQMFIIYKVTQLGTKIAIDRDGKIVYRGAKGFHKEDWEELLTTITA